MAISIAAHPLHDFCISIRQPEPARVLTEFARSRARCGVYDRRGRSVRQLLVFANRAGTTIPTAPAGALSRDRKDRLVRRSNRRHVALRSLHSFCQRGPPRIARGSARRAATGRDRAGPDGGDLVRRPRCPARVAQRRPAAPQRLRHCHRSVRAPHRPRTQPRAHATADHDAPAGSEVLGALHRTRHLPQVIDEPRHLLTAPVVVRRAQDR